MNKWLRWQGVAAFLCCVVVLALFWFLFADGMVRRMVQKYGTRAVGAKVDVADADISLFPAGLELNGVAVTNPDAPMENAVELSTVKVDLDALNLIRRKLIINNLIVSGMRFNTPRQTSGAVKSPGKKKDSDETGVISSTKAGLKKVCGDVKIPSFQLPDASEILKNESLKSLALASSLKTESADLKQVWQKKLDNLPDEKKLNEYKARIEKLKPGKGSFGSILGSAGDVASLQKEIQKDIDNIKKAQDDFSRQIAEIKSKTLKLSGAPAEDIKRLTEKYTLSPKGLANMSRIIFGEKFCAWIEKAAVWYEKAKPLLERVPETGKKEGDTPAERGKGVDVHFADTFPLPDFLIRNLKVNAMLDEGDLTGKMNNITPDQPKLGVPMTFAFLGRNMKEIKSLNLNGVADYVVAGTPKNNISLTVNQLNMGAVSLGDKAPIPLTLKQATSDISMNLNTKGDQLDVRIQGLFNDVTFSVDESGGKDSIIAAVAGALSNAGKFSLDADIKGTFDDYQMEIRSDLDKMLNATVKNMVKAEASKLKKELKKKIMAKVNGPMKDASGSAGALDGIQGELAKRVDLGDDLLKGVKLPF